MANPGMKFIRKNGKIIPIKDDKSGGGGGKGGKQVYRDGAAKAGIREYNKEKRAEKLSGGRKFQIAGLGVMGLGFLNLKNMKSLRGLALSAAGAGLVGYGRHKMNKFSKGEQKKRSTSPDKTPQPGT